MTTNTSLDLQNAKSSGGVYIKEGLPIDIIIFIYYGECVIVNQRGEKMKDILIMLAIVAVWFVLQKYILPVFGVST